MRRDVIDHYTGVLEIMQAPLANEIPATMLDNDNEEKEDEDDMWQAFLAISDYPVKNTFISFEVEPTYPLRHVRSAAGRLTQIDGRS